MENWFILVLIAGSAVGTGLTIWALRRNTAKKADYAQIAQDLGWQYSEESTSGGYGSADTFSDPEDDWKLQIIFIGGGPSGGSSTRRIEWHTPQGALTEGEAVLGMPIPAKTAAMLNSGTMGEQIVKAALKGTMYALGKTNFNLSIDSATAGDPGGVVMSTPGQEREMDIFRRNVTLTEFRATRKDANVPIIIRNDKGMTLRRPNVTSDADELKAIVELGKDLRADL
ncbi:MAG: hypothetical protein AAFY25_12405 [Pseudomonadota bacterium]